MPDYGSRLDMKKLIDHVIDSGVTFLDASGVYDPQINEHLMGDMGELKKLVEEGKIKYVGLSEASASTIRRAHVVHPWFLKLFRLTCEASFVILESKMPRFQPNNIKTTNAIFEQVSEMATCDV
ncbi:hypothetical protein LguiB_012933 [Lonicera macranthoides]